MRGMNQDQQILLSAQRQEPSARASLVVSLVRMGRLEEALGIASETGLYPKAWVQEIFDAENEPDDKRCDCEHSHDEADYVKNPNASPKLVSANNYRRKFRYWSAQYSQMVWFHACLLCGHANALPDAVKIKST